MLIYEVQPHRFGKEACDKDAVERDFWMSLVWDAQHYRDFKKPSTGGTEMN